jgi:alkylhydroperoxidase family enzyme
MARISLDPPRGLIYRAMEWYSRRVYGTVLDPGRALAHNPKVLAGYARTERSAATWDRLDGELKTLAVMASSAAVGCPWCMDFGYWEAYEQGMDRRKLHDVPLWRSSTAFTPLERDVLEYAEGMSATPPDVGDALAARLVERLGEPAFVELTAMVALENMRSRMNAALGLTSQGFKERCPVDA